MFKISVVAKFNNEFTGYLFFDERHIGGIGKDINGIYVKIKKRVELTLAEMKELIVYISSLDTSYSELPIQIIYTTEWKNKATDLVLSDALLIIVTYVH